MPRFPTILQKVLLAVTIIAGIHLVVVLFTGGFTIHLGGAVYVFDDLALTVISVLVFIFAFLLARHAFTFHANEIAILFILTMVVYMANGKTLSTRDTLGSRYLPFSILREGNFDLNEFRFIEKEKGSYWFVEMNHRYVPWYPVGGAMLSLPIFLPSAMGRVDASGDFPRQLEKLAAASLTALSVVLIFLTLRRLVDRKYAFLLAFIYAFGTSSLSISSQALWQHGPSQLCIAAALHCLVRGKSEPHWIPPAGAALAMSVVCRPFDILIALPLCLYVAIYNSRQLVRFILCGLPFAIFQLWFNVNYFGTFTIGQTAFTGADRWRGPLAVNLARLLFSPARGLFVYSPVLLFLIPAIVKIWKHREYVLLRFLSVCALLTVLIYSKWTEWAGGFSFGPRFFADLLPLFVLMLTPLESFLRESKFSRILLYCLFALSIAAHFIGAFVDDRYWNVYLEQDKHLAWSWTDNQLVNPLKRSWRRSWMHLRRLSTSKDSPSLLAASYQSNLPKSFEIEKSTKFTFQLSITNSGQAVLLSWPSGVNGWTRLGWRWQKGGKELVRTTQFVRLQNDLFPGESENIVISVESPEKPGVYVLVVELAVGGAGWLSDLGVPPMKVDAVVK